MTPPSSFLSGSPRGETTGSRAGLGRLRVDVALLEEVVKVLVVVVVVGAGVAGAAGAAGAEVASATSAAAHRPRYPITLPI